MEGGRAQDVGMSVCWTGSACGAVGSTDLCVWPLPSALRVSSSIFIDPLRLMSPATGGIKLQRSHTSQEESEREREREERWGRAKQGMSDVGGVGGSGSEDEGAQVSDKNESKEKQTPKGQSLGARGGLGSLLGFESATHKTCRGNISAADKNTHTRGEQTRTHTQTCACKA